MDPSAVVQVINQAAASYGSANESQKAQLVEACTALISSLESPKQKLMSLLFEPVKLVALRLGIDMHFFDVSAEALEKGENVTIQQLSDETKCEALLIRRVMRILVGMQTFHEIDQNVFQPQPIVALYQTESVMAQATIHFTSHLMRLFKLPDYFEENPYKCPSDAFDGPFQYAVGTKLHAFDWLATKPKLQHASNVTMTLAHRSGDPEWFEIYPVERLLVQDASPHAFMVDLGGGLGHLLVDFKERHPDVPGKLIVQDIAPVIDSIESLPPGIEAMAHDFFKPQPVRLAKIYFMAHIIHDWPDKQAKTILEHVRDAMDRGSVLLLSETVMPERNVSFLPAVLDFTMMAAFSSLERTENQFKDLLSDAGLDLVRVWNPKETDLQSTFLGQSILEARLKP